MSVNDFYCGLVREKFFSSLDFKQEVFTTATKYKD
jgi:hypothetical protein